MSWATIHGMAKRGDVLRLHILWAAKEVILGVGFERASMDVIASRAGTSKRSLYAHFESKEKVFLAVIELVRGLFLGKLRLPGDYSETPIEALTAFCGRFLEILLYRGSIQMCRVTMAETDRFPEGAQQYYDLLFNQVQARLATYLKGAFTLTPRASADVAQKLLAQVLHPRFTRTLFGLDEPGKHLDEHAIAPDFDLKPIRKIVTELVSTLKPRA